jgi:folate-binding protein YgfZ
MPFKTNRPASPLPVLAGFGLLGAEGPHAAAFLQAQAMNDVAALGVGQWHWNGWLSAKGRVLALCALLRTRDESIVLVLPDEPAQALRDALARFVFRSKVRLAVLADRVCAAEWVDADTPVNDARDVAARVDEAWVLDLGGDAAARRLWVLPADSAWAGHADGAHDARWRRADLWHGLPRLSPAQREQWTPQMLSLQRLKAFSLRKGCYPGQEIVARTHYLGQAKRELVLVRGAGLAEGAVLNTVGDGAAQGTVVCVADAADLGLAVAIAGTADQSWVSQGCEVERVALAGGLQRPA